MPGARCSTSSESGLAIANVLGTGVELNGDCLDPAHVLEPAEAAARLVTGGQSVVVEKKSAARRGLCSPCRHSPDPQKPLEYIN